MDGKPVCDNSWDHLEALVVCRWALRSRLMVFPRMFGYSRGVARTNSYFGGVEQGTEFGNSDFRYS